jgi:hypothetical protein
MCDKTDWNGCIDLNNAKNGVRTLMGMLNPPYAQIGMVAFPPLTTASSSVCSAPPGTSSDYTAYDSANRRYLTDQISDDYKRANGSIDTTSGLYTHTDPGNSNACIRADGYTSYSEALRQAKQELDMHGRPSVADVIVFLTDGEANIGSVYGPDDPEFPPDNADDQRPCQTAIDLADSYKEEGVTIYSIGYALGDNVPCTRGEYGPWIPRVKAVKAKYDRHGRLTRPARPEVPAHWCDRSIPAEAGDCFHHADDASESPRLYSEDVVEEIASAGAFYSKPSAGQLNTIFAAIATDIGAGSSRLVDDDF